MNDGFRPLPTKERPLPTSYYIGQLYRLLAALGLCTAALAIVFGLHLWWHH